MSDNPKGDALDALLRQVRGAVSDLESAAHNVDDAAADLESARDEIAKGLVPQGPRPADEVFEVAVQRLHLQAHNGPTDSVHWRFCQRPGCQDLATDELSPRAVA